MLILHLILAESDIFANLADGFGRDVEERGDVLQVEMLHDAQAIRSFCFLFVLLAEQVGMGTRPLV